MICANFWWKYRCNFACEKLCTCFASLFFRRAFVKAVYAIMSLDENFWLSLVSRHHMVLATLNQLQPSLIYDPCAPMQSVNVIPKIPCFFSYLYRLRHSSWDDFLHIYCLFFLRFSFCFTIIRQCIRKSFVTTVNWYQWIASQISVLEWYSILQIRSTKQHLIDTGCVLVAFFEVLHIEIKMYMPFQCNCVVRIWLRLFISEYTLKSNFAFQCLDSGLAS